MRCLFSCCVLGKKLCTAAKKQLLGVYQPTLLKEDHRLADVACGCDHCRQRHRCIAEILPRPIVSLCLQEVIIELMARLLVCQQTLSSAAMFRACCALFVFFLLCLLLSCVLCSMLRQRTASTGRKVRILYTAGRRYSYEWKGSDFANRCRSK